MKALFTPIQSLYLTSFHFRPMDWSCRTNDNIDKWHTLLECLILGTQQIHKYSCSACTSLKLCAVHVLIENPTKAYYAGLPGLPYMT